MRWKVVTCIDLGPTRELWKQTKVQQKKVAEFCQKRQGMVSPYSLCKFRAIYGIKEQIHK
jgi:hypothetical protein